MFVRRACGGGREGGWWGGVETRLDHTEGARVTRGVNIDIRIPFPCPFLRLHLRLHLFLQFDGRLHLRIWEKSASVLSTHKPTTNLNQPHETTGPRDNCRSTLVPPKHECAPSPPLRLSSCSVGAQPLSPRRRPQSSKGERTLSSLVLVSSSTFTHPFGFTAVYLSLPFAHQASSQQAGPSHTLLLIPTSLSRSLSQSALGPAALTQQLRVHSASARGPQRSRFPLVRLSQPPRNDPLTLLRTSLLAATGS